MNTDKHSSFIIPLFFFLLTTIMAGCAQAEKVSMPTAQPVTPSAGKGAISARVDGLKEMWPDAQVISIYAAPFYGDESSKGIYVLDPSLHPQTTLDGTGVFQLNNMTPGRYVLVVGPAADSGQVVLDEQGKTRVVTVKADVVLQLGVVKLAKKDFTAENTEGAKDIRIYR
jgi:hypothetical protein